MKLKIWYLTDPETLLINREVNPTGNEIRLAAKGESFLPCLEAKNSVQNQNKLSAITLVKCF